MAAFEFFGVPARLVCDNLKTGVERPDLTCMTSRSTSPTTVKGILIAGTEHGDDPPGQHSAPISPVMLRGPDAFDTDLTA